MQSVAHLPAYCLCKGQLFPLCPAGAALSLRCALISSAFSVGAGCALTGARAVCISCCGTAFTPLPYGGSAAFQRAVAPGALSQTFFGFGSNEFLRSAGLRLLPAEAFLITLAVFVILCRIHNL